MSPINNGSSIVGGSGNLPRQGLLETLRSLVKKCDAVLIFVVAAIILLVVIAILVFYFLFSNKPSSSPEGGSQTQSQGKGGDSGSNAGLGVPSGQEVTPGDNSSSMPNSGSSSVPNANGSTGSSTSPSPGGGSTNGGSSVAQTSNCAPNPHLCGYPDATNSGPTAGTSFKRVPEDITSPDSTTGSGWHYDSRGWITVDTDGAVIKNISTNLNVDVTANNVTVMNNKIAETGDGFGVSLRHTANAIVENNEIAGTNATSGRLGVAVKDIYGDTTGTQVLANNIFYVSTGIQLDSGLIKDNYIHDLGLIAGDHINGTTANGGNLNQLTVSHNTVFNQFDQTDAISLFEDFGVQANKVIDNNLIAGGGYSIYGGQNSGGIPTYNIQVTNNRFSRLYFPNGGYYGPATAWNTSGAGNVWSGNVWDDSGATVGAP